MVFHDSCREIQKKVPKSSACGDCGDGPATKKAKTEEMETVTVKNVSFVVKIVNCEHNSKTELCSREGYLKFELQENCGRDV